MRWTWASLFGAFLLGRIAILVQGVVYTSFDSLSYRGDPGALVSFTGHAPRPWGVPLFFAVFPDDQARAIAQWLLGTLAWAFLAWATVLLLHRPIARILAVAGILFIGLLRPVASWDFAILSESLTITLGVLTLALFLWWMRTRPLWVLIAMTAVAVWWTFTRVDMFIMLVPLGVALLLYRTRAPLIAALVLALAAGWSYFVVGPRSLETHQQWSFAPQLSHERGLLMYRLRINVFPDPEVKSVFERDLGMPRCPAAEDFVAANAEWAVDRFAVAVDSCAELRAWTIENERGVWTRYATAAPGLFARQVAQQTGSTLSGAAYADTPSVVTVPVEKMAFPKRYALPLNIAALLAAVALALFTGGYRRQLFWTGIALAATALASATATVIVSSGEVWRFGIQEAIAIRVAIVLLIAVAVDTYSTRRRMRSSSLETGVPS